MKIVGYVNPNGFFPSPLITIAEDQGEYCAFYPGGGPFHIDDLTAVKKEINDFIENKSELEISTGEYAYAIDQKTILVKPPNIMYSELKSYLKQHCDEPAHEILSEYLRANVKDNPNCVTWDFFITWIYKLHRVRVLITTRTVKKSHKEGKRVIVQLSKHSNYKTFYKKNIPVNQDYKQINVKSFLVKSFAPKLCTSSL